MCFTRKILADALSRLNEPVAQYSLLQGKLHEVNVATDGKFQRLFKRLYKVRLSSIWLTPFFAVLQRHKSKGLKFDNALRQLRQVTGRFEASFASKLVATIDDSKPVIDQHVLRHAELRLPWYGAMNREAGIIDTYRRLEEWMSNLRQSECGRNAIAAFRQRFPATQISDAKILDFILWQIRNLDA